MKITPSSFFATTQQVEAYVWKVAGIVAFIVVLSAAGCAVT